jgi:hypothetical protein
VRVAVTAAALGALFAVPAATAAAADPKPETGRTVVVERVGGTVMVQPRGKRLTTLRAARSLPVGSTIDATSGTVKLTSTADRSGSKLQSAVFRDGAFKVTQRTANHPLTELELVGGDFQDCGATVHRPGVLAAASRGRRRLWGSGKGRFRTRGRNGTATVRGTTWLTEDSCEGTKAENRSSCPRNSRKVCLHKVLAKSTDLSYTLDPGQSVVFTCNTEGITGVVGLYCLAVLSQPADNVFGFGIAAQTPDDSYELCITGPDGVLSCGPFPFGAPDNGIRAAGVGCLPGKVGTHTVYWRLRGTDLPVPLPFESTRPSNRPFCVSDPRRPGIDPPASRATVAKVRAAARGS